MGAMQPKNTGNAGRSRLALVICRMLAVGSLVLIAADAGAELRRIDGYTCDRLIKVLREEHRPPALKPLFCFSDFYFRSNLALLNLEAIELFLVLGKDPNRLPSGTDVDGLTPLQVVLNYLPGNQEDQSAVYTKIRRAVDLLLAYKADPKLKNLAGEDAITFAGKYCCRRGYISRIAEEGDALQEYLRYKAE